MNLSQSHLLSYSQRDSFVQSPLVRHPQKLQVEVLLELIAEKQVIAF